MSSNRTTYKNNHKRVNSAYGRNASSGRNSLSRQNTRSYTSYNTRTDKHTRTTGGSSTRGYGYYNSFSNYNTSSVAHDYFYDTDVPVIRHKKKRTKHTVEKEIVQLNMPKTIVSIAVIFAFSLALLCSYAVNSSYRSEIASKQAELAEIQEENQYLKTTLEDNVDLNKIAKEAEKIGLQKPQAYQITEVQVPNESYTVQYDAKIATQDKSIWEFLKSLFNK